MTLAPRQTKRTYCKRRANTINQNFGWFGRINWEMTTVSNLFRSLLLSVLLSFVTPLLFLGGILGALLTASYIPGIAILGQIGQELILSFLSTFGEGYPLQGMLTIGGTCAMVGGLFDVFNFYLYQDIHGQ
ncbi:hypothetical protein CY0110_11327 [Crocosphaera chwakensis CCY0110]|uniref:Uncharacterized protein n=2 Tax=Crocosphaera TaxID=263510 RepID=A3IQD6_9CHRO|nr:hypothetical protein CY0110_11327 [Crocosphaera chwakensis CCY0110]